MAFPVSSVSVSPIRYHGSVSQPQFSAIERPAGVPPNDQIKVMIIEDESIAKDMIRNLKTWGFHLLHEEPIRTPLDALVYLVKFAEKGRLPDVLLMDWVLAESKKNSIALKQTTLPPQVQAAYEILDRQDDESLSSMIGIYRLVNTINDNFKKPPRISIIFRDIFRERFVTISKEAKIDETSIGKAAAYGMTEDFVSKAIYAAYLKGKKVYLHPGKRKSVNIKPDSFLTMQFKTMGLPIKT